MKMTKKMAIERLAKVDLGSLKDDTLKGIISYTLGVYEKNARNVTVEDLEMVLADLEEAKVELPKLEKLAPVAEVKKVEEPKVEEPKAPKEEPKKVTKKVTKKAVSKKKVEPKEEPTKEETKKVTKKAEAPKAPETIKLGEKTLKRVGVLKDYLASDEILYTVGHVSPETLHDIDTYNDLGLIPKKLKNLPDDFDIVNLVWVTDKIVYGVSVYTQVFYTFLIGKNSLPVYIEI